MRQEMVAAPVRDGLSTEEASRLLAVHGPNELPAERRPPVAILLLRQLTHFFALLLWSAAGLAVIARMPQLGIAITLVVLINGGFAFAQEYRAERAVDQLRELLPVSAVVRRDGRRTQVPVTDLVPDDVVLLAAGDRIGADVRTTVATGLAADESMLTGESVPRRLEVGEQLYAGTFVVEGTAEAVVTATGNRTRLAGIAGGALPAAGRPDGSGPVRARPARRHRPGGAFPG